MDNTTDSNLHRYTSLLFQVIANMTVGKDVSILFPDVVNCIQTGECLVSGDQYQVYNVSLNSNVTKHI